MSSDSVQDRSNLRLPWSSLALAGGIAALASLGTLAVVVSINDVDLLSAVALALAILAFATQIVVSLSQSQAATQQLASSERVNAETRGLLAQITAQSTALLANQSGQFDRVLDAALGADAIQRAVRAATPETEQGNDDSLSDLDATALATALRAEARNSIRADGRSSLATLDLLASNPYLDFVDELTTWPTKDESREALEVLLELKPWESGMLLKRAIRDLERARLGLKPQGYTRVEGGFGPVTQSLIEKGLLAYSEGTWPGTDSPALIRTLTPLGRSVARLLNPGEIGDTPDWLKDAQRDVYERP